MRLFKVMLTTAVLTVGMTAIARAETAQQQKMTTCSTDAKAKGLKGDDRKAYMKTCLSGSAAATADKQLTPQQQKMKTCSTDAKAKGLKGDDRKAYMKTCLSGSTS